MNRQLAPLHAAGFVTAFGAHSIAAGLGTSSDFSLLFAVLGGLALLVCLWARVAVPVLAPLPRTRQTLVDLVRSLTEPGFLRATATLAGTTAVLSVGVGFLPVAGRALGLTALVTGAAVSLLALSSTLAQPWAGRARDAGRLPDRVGMALGLTVSAVGLVLAVVPHVSGLPAAAVVIGAGVGLATPLGFAHLASVTPDERMGRTMGAAEVGRELGDAGGPLLVGALAVALSLNAGFLALATLLALTAAFASRPRRPLPTP